MCPKVAGYSSEHDLFEDPHSCDPAGAIFRQTLEDLNEVDRLVLLFCSSSNLAAVRWLFVLGASREACDTNGTTCLHAACRSGSLGVVRDLIARGLPVNTGDISGWTALHIAAFMGRRNVAIELMQNGAELKRRSLKGLAPADLCSDGWLREAIYSCNAHRERNPQDGDKWQFGRENDLAEDIQVTSRLRFEPFFVPRSPALRDTERAPHLQRLGITIFNQRPGQGLAFLVATGAVRDFPIELSTFLLENKVSRVQVGEFLGEDFSLSQTLRLEFVNSVRLTGTGVVSSLQKVFKQLHIPTDMQKIDRLLEGVAQIWWRQHERLKDYPHHVVCEDSGDDAEYEGLRLMKMLTNYGVLHQLMFSAVLLHWSLYAPMPPSQHILMKQWLEMTEGFGVKDGVDKVALQRMHKQIYTTISRAFIPQLQIWNAQTQGLGRLPAPPGSSSTAEAKDEDEEDGFVASEEKREEVLEGWGRLVGGGFPAAAGAGSVGSTVTYRHLRSIHCETTASALAIASRVNSRLDSMDLPPQAPDGVENVPPSVAHRYAVASAGKVEPKNGHGIDGSGTDRVWLVLQNSLLLFAASPRNWAPYAFVYLSQLIIHSVEPQSHMILLQQHKQVATKDGAEKANGGFLRTTGSAKEALEQTAQIQVVFLLPDGRWQAIEIPRLEIQLSGADELEKWKSSLAVYCSPESLPAPLEKESDV